jgi:hypothetical protein
MRYRTASLLAALCLLLGLLGRSALAWPTPGDGTKPITRAKVAFELRDRTGYEYRWEYNVVAHVQARGSGQPLTDLRVLATGKMNVPGHAMQTQPESLRPRGDGVYVGSLAFYMPGKWRVLVSVKGAGIVPSVTPFPVFLDPSDRHP